MRANDGGVDHLHRVWNGVAVDQGFKKQIPQASARPSEKLPIDRTPFAEIFRQIAPGSAGPGDPEYTVENTSVVIGRTTALRSSLDKERLIERPFSIR
jgi:hypothetical protein